MMPGSGRRCLLATLVLGLTCAVGRPAAGQEIPPADSVGAGATASAGVSPGGAFLRSMLIPGWGHAAVGAYTRGGFYFGAEAGAAWMLFKTLSFLDAARDRRAVLEAAARMRIETQGVTDPDSIQSLLDEDDRLQEAKSLVRAREAQREDWLALGVFVLLLGGADAFVSAHLADFPQPVEIETAVLPATHQVELSVSIPWGGPGG